jgi:hypothetical protein
MSITSKREADTVTRRVASTEVTVPRFQAFVAVQLSRNGHWTLGWEHNPVPSSQAPNTK